MVDYYRLPSTNHNLPEPDPDEEQPAPAPLVVDCVINTYKERNGTTFACKLVIQLPLQSGEGS